jgi:hypothetical protein
MQSSFQHSHLISIPLSPPNKVPQVTDTCQKQAHPGNADFGEDRMQYGMTLLGLRRDHIDHILPQWPIFVLFDCQLGRQDRVSIPGTSAIGQQICNLNSRGSFNSKDVLGRTIRCSKKSILGGGLGI